MSDINVLFRDMPCRIRGFTRANPDMSYTIVLNARLSREALLRTYLHEIKHIEGGDLYRVDMTAGEIEAQMSEE